MTNLLNSIIANQSLNSPTRNESIAFTFDSKGKAKPLQDKAVLLPSRIFGSPIEYAKDTAKDIVSIGKAARGRANDYELGRINDLAMKVGSFAIAAYLFMKNPLKLSKTMEFVGFGTFFASMALWPKLAIQMPIKARTGVDFQQEYIDSQGRKKLLYQDPQYVLTDLLPREDLDNIGNKLEVNENLPDRDNFIKQRAHQTALQANTLWMMTAGFAAPVMTALVCNAGEKALKPYHEKIDLDKTEIEFSNCLNNKNFGNNPADERISEFSKYLKANSEKPLDNAMIDKLSTQLSNIIQSENSSNNIKEAIAQDLKNLAETDKTVNENLIDKVFGENTYSSLHQKYKNGINIILNNTEQSPENKIEQISDILASSKKIKIFRKNKDGKDIEVTDFTLKRNKIIKKFQNAFIPKKVGEFKETIEELFKSLTYYADNKKVLDTYVDARVGKRQGTYIANQWDRLGKIIINSLNIDNPFTTTELKKIANGNQENLIQTKLKELVKDDNNFEKVVSEFMSAMDEVETMTNDKTEKGLMHNVKKFNSEKLTLDNCKGVNTKEIISTLTDIMNKQTEQEVIGAKSSLYKMLHTLITERRIEDGSFEKDLTEKLIALGKKPDAKRVAEIAKTCENILMSATTTSYIERLKTKSFKLNNTELRAAMEVLFDDKKNDGIINKILENKNIDEETQKRMTDNFKQFRYQNWDAGVCYDNGIRPDFSKRKIDTKIKPIEDGTTRNNLIGKPIKDFIVDLAKEKYNSKKWTLLFSGIMAGLTAITIGAGLTFGAKSKTEKQAEQEIMYAA